MMKHTKHLLVLWAALLLGAGNAWGATGTITFGNNYVKINSASVTGNDDLGNSWTITTVGTTSFTSSTSYYQVGSSKAPATSITFTTTLASSVNITAMSAKFGGFSGTAGTISLKVGDTEIGSGSLNATNDVTISSTKTASGTTLTVTITGISKAVKCYHISYTYEVGSTEPTVYLGLFLAAFVAVRACVRRVECLYATFHHIIMSKIDFRSVHFAKECFVRFFCFCCSFLLLDQKKRTKEKSRLWRLRCQKFVVSVSAKSNSLRSDSDLAFRHAQLDF